LAASLAIGALASCAPYKAASKNAYRIVVITPKEAIAPGAFAGAEDFVRSGAAKRSGASAIHAVLPEGIASGDRRKPGAEAAMASFVASQAEDPLVRAIVVDPALPGCAEGFREAKAARPGIVCVAGDSREDELALESSADLLVDLDRAYRAYLIAWETRKMGATSLVSVYSAAEGDDPTAARAAAREQAIMSAAAADLGLKYVSIETPPGSDPAAYARAMTGTWLRADGPGAALYCSDPSLVGPLIAGAVAYGGYLVDAAASATCAAYAAALGLDLGPAKGDASKERAIVEKAVAGLGLRGRLGLWGADYQRSTVAGMAEFAQRVVEQASRRESAKAEAGSPIAEASPAVPSLPTSVDSRSQLLAALSSAHPEAGWSASYDIDPVTGVKSANRVLLREDVYVLGSGYIQSALQQVPIKYLAQGAPSR